MDSALLFERDGVEEIDLDGGLPRLGRSSVLWIDLEQPSEQDIRAVARSLDLDDDCAADFATPDGRRTMFGDYGDYLHVTMLAPSDDAPTRVSCLVAERWVVTVRDGPVEVLETFRERACGSGELGRLDGLEFLANLAEWVLGAYFDEFERVERVLEEIDTAAMSGRLATKDEVIERLVGVRARSRISAGRSRPIARPSSGCRGPSSRPSRARARPSGSRGSEIGWKRRCRPPATAVNPSSVRSTSSSQARGSERTTS